jgi:hypothetical protein
MKNFFSFCSKINHINGQEIIPKTKGISYVKIDSLLCCPRKLSLFPSEWINGTTI